MEEKIFNFLWGLIPFILRKIFWMKKLSELNILFIDDEHEELSIIKTLRDNREFWEINSIWDLDNLDNLYLKNADIIFLDTLWIWHKMQVKNGTKLVGSLKNKYPTKLITIYSSKPLPKDTHLMAGVTQIPKNSSYEVFRSHIQTIWETKK